MPDTNDLLINADVRRAVLLRRIENQIANELINGFGVLQNKIIVSILQSGETLSARELASLLKNLREIQQEFYKGFNSDLLAQLRTIAQDEAKYAIDVMGKLDITAVPVSTDTILKQMMLAPIQVGRNQAGIIMNDFLKQFGESQISMINGIVRNGYYRGQTLNELTKLIKGTKTQEFKDGAFALTERDARAVARTAINHTSNQAKLAVWRESGVVKGWKFLAVLDSRTSQVCRAVSSLDKIYDLDDTRNIPPLHYQCRSQTTAVLADKYAQLGEGATQSSEFGPVDADMTYYDWLKTQSEKYVKDVLGKNWGEIFIKGRIDAKQFAQLQLNSRFEPLTLDEARKKQAWDFDDLFG